MYQKEELIGKRVKLIFMEDPYPIESGQEGVIVRVDDMGGLHVKWDDGRSLAILPDVDRYEILS